MQSGFATAVGYILGILVILVVSGVCLKPLKTVMRFLINSIAGVLIAVLINFVGSLWGIHIGINPFTAVLLGILGVPGIILILILQIFY